MRGLVRFADALGIRLYTGQRAVLEAWAASGPSHDPGPALQQPVDARPGSLARHPRRARALPDDRRGPPGGAHGVAGLVPSVAQFGPMGYVLVTSTPLWGSGLFYDLCRSGEAADSDVLHVHLATWECTARISRESLAGEFAADPEGATREYGAEFVEGLGAYLLAAGVHAVVPGRRALPPVPGRRHVAAADPAFAAGGDSFTFGIAHREGSRDQARVVLDRLEAWRGRSGPLSSDLVRDEIADLAKLYGGA